MFPYKCIPEKPFHPPPAGARAGRGWVGGRAWWLPRTEPPPHRTGTPGGGGRAPHLAPAPPLLRAVLAPQLLATLGEAVGDERRVDPVACPAQVYRVVAVVMGLGGGSRGVGLAAAGGSDCLLGDIAAVLGRGKCEKY